MAVTAIVNHSVPFPGQFSLTVVPADPENQRSYLLSRDELLVLKSRVDEALAEPVDAVGRLTSGTWHPDPTGREHYHPAGDVAHEHPSSYDPTSPMSREAQAHFQAAEVGL